MDTETLLIFLGLVFVTVFLLSQLLIVPTFGTDRAERRRLRQRLEQIAADADFTPVSLVRQEYLKELRGIERWLESMPWAPPLQSLIERSGQMYPSYRLLLRCLLLGLSGLGVGWLVSDRIGIALVAGVIAALLPIARLRKRRQQRIAEFEAQLPEALELMARALRAGNPFSVAVSFIAEQMEGTVAEEFRLTHTEIKYGRDVNQAFLYLIDRVPSMSLMAMTTAVIIQRETGGNLGEVLDKIASVLRSRFKFQRRVRTLTAEGRISAWVLALIPLLLFAALSMIDPEYVGTLTGTVAGQRLLTVGVVLLGLGMFWMSRLIRIEV